jgi:hypothetical protein
MKRQVLSEWLSFVALVAFYALLIVLMVSVSNGCDEYDEECVELYPGCGELCCTPLEDCVARAAEEQFTCSGQEQCAQVAVITYIVCSAGDE